jgi:hypothetical protein
VLADRQSKRLALELERDERYGLRMAKVGVGTNYERPQSAYVTSVSGEAVAVPENESTAVEIEVRDAYNNPVPGALVSANTTWDNSSLGFQQATTGDDGRVRFTYVAPANVDGPPSTDQLRVSTVGVPGDAFDADTPTNVSVNVSVRNANGSGLARERIAPAYEVRWRDPSGTGDNPNAQLSACDAADCTWDVENSQDATLTLPAMTDPNVDGGTLEFSVDDGSVGTVRNVDPTDGTGNVTAEMRARDNGTVTVYVDDAGSSDSIDVIVESVTRLGLVYETDATARDFGGSSQDTPALVDFSITNTREQSIAIEGVTIKDSTAGAGLFAGTGNGNREVTFDTDGDGIAEGFARDNSRLTFGTRIDLDDSATLPAGDTARVELTEVVTAADEPVDVTGEELTVSVHYVIGGTQYTDTFDVKEIDG